MSTRLPSSRAGALSLEKKRARDRRAQQTHRQKKQRLIEMLQDELASCKRQMLAQGSQLEHIMKICQSLRLENQSLLAQQNCVSGFVNAWQSLSMEHQRRGLLDPALSASADKATSYSWALSAQTSSPPSSALAQQTISSSGPSLSNLVPLRLPLVNDSLSLILPQSSASLATVASEVSTAPPWNLLPLHANFPLGEATERFPWSRDLQSAAQAADLPRPLDLLYGSKNNRFANLIYSDTQRAACRDPERLACGWLIYLVSRWMLKPTEETFSLLPDFMKPVSEQITYAHPSCIDSILWPKMRANLIMNQHVCDVDRVIDMLACCLKVKWPWGKAILEPGEDNDLHMRDDFYSTFMSVDGWGLTPEFVREFPQLLEGLDIGKIQYEMF